jgi:ketosteroid isomerase-like protein
MKQETRRATAGIPVPQGGEDVNESSDYLVAQLTNTAVLKATGKTVVLQNAWLFEVASGRLASAQLYADTAAVHSSAG